MKFIDDILEAIKVDGFWKTCIGIIFVIIIYILATLCYLIEHIYNLFTGKGWTGMSLW